MAIYTGSFKSKKEIVENFDLDKDLLNDYEVLFAGYDVEEYSGYAVVILKHKIHKTLHQVFAGRCSCDGLKGKFDIEDTDIRHIRTLLKNGAYNPFNEEIKKMLFLMSI